MDATNPLMAAWRRKMTPRNEKAGSNWTWRPAGGEEGGVGREEGREGSFVFKAATSSAC
jgi:hypothetical protein